MKKLLNPTAFFPAFIGLAIFIVIGVFYTKFLGGFLDSALQNISENFGWLFMVVGLICLGACIYLAFSKTGKIRFGGENAKPDLTLWQWFTICLCSGIGTGILFWGSSEPMFHYANPPEATGLVSFTRDAGINAVSQSVFHWTIIQYSMYTIGALGAALVAYKQGEDFSIKNTLKVLLGEKRSKGTIGALIHAVAIFGLCGAVASSTAVAILQISSGLNNIAGITDNAITWFFVAIIITSVFTISSISGMKKGLKNLANINTYLFFFMALFILAVGPTVFIGDIGVAAFGDFISTFFEKATITNALTTDNWPRDWSVQYYASFVVVAPLIGLFYARLAKGRTLKQFILVTILGPSAFGLVWISIYGGAAIYLQSTGQTDLWQSIQELGMQSTVFNIFNQFPLSKVLSVVFLLALSISLITYADPMTSVLSVLSSKSIKIDEEPPKILKLIWGISIGTIAYILIATGGIDGVRAMFTLIGFPLIFLLLALCYMAIKLSLNELKGKKHEIN